MSPCSRALLTILAAGTGVALFQTRALAEVTLNVRTPLDLTQFVPCANGGRGENVRLTGDLHTLASVTVSGKDVLLTVHNQPQDVSGTGSVTGEKYHATGVTRDDFHMVAASFPSQFTSLNNFRIVGQGPSNNLIVHENTHFTVNANGVPTAVVDNFRLDCK